MNLDEFRRLYLCDFPAPTERELELEVLVQLCFDAMEAFDRSVCTGVMKLTPRRRGDPSSIAIPATPQELTLINANARLAYAKLRLKAAGQGFRQAEVDEAIKRHVQRN